MPDAANNFHRIIKVPNLGLCSIAAHLTDHEVRIVDLVLVHTNIRSWLKNFLAGFHPSLIGISSMSFQYTSALEVMSICREVAPGARIVLGGYHASLAYAQLAEGNSAPFDFLVRGEGEQAVSALVEALEGSRDFDSVPGLSWLSNGAFIHNPTGELQDVQQ
jgi:radical SAM superfamily enzyme YgiQ (UPF0313 family)